MCAGQSIDKDNSGTITVDELKVGLREQGSTVTEAELGDLVRSLDADNSGTIDYEVRLTAFAGTRCTRRAVHLKDIRSHAMGIARAEVLDAICLRWPKLTGCLHTASRAWIIRDAVPHMVRRISPP